MSKKWGKVGTICFGIFLMLVGICCFVITIVVIGGIIAEIIEPSHSFTKELPNLGVIVIFFVGLGLFMLGATIILNS